MRSGEIVGERKFASLVGWNCTREILTNLRGELANKQMGVYCSSPTMVYYCDR